MVMTTEPKNVVIAGARRTPIGAFQGNLASVDAQNLGALCIKESLTAASVSIDSVDEVILSLIHI